MTAAAGRPAVHRDDGAGNFALQRLLQRFRGRPVQLVTRHLDGRRRRIAALDRSRLSGDDHGLELERIFVEGHGHAGLRRGHSHFLALVPDRANHEPDIAGADVDGEVPVGARLCDAFAAHLDDRRAEDGRFA